MGEYEKALAEGSDAPKSLLIIFREVLKDRDGIREENRILEGVIKTTLADSDRKGERLAKLVEAAGLVMGDWPNQKVRDYLRAVLNWIEFGHEIGPFPYR